MKLLATVFAALFATAFSTTAPARSALEDGRSFRDCRSCSEMVVLRAGRYKMGSAASEPGRHPDEGPQTEVEIASFAIGRTDVTRREWAAFASDTHRLDGLGCAYSGLPKEEAAAASWRHLGFEQRGDEPVVCVSWKEAQAYVEWLSTRTGRRYRLPTEAEWEYAARAGTTTAYPWGDQATHDYANYGSDTCCTGARAGRDVWTSTSPVRAFPPNAFGLYDMIGNAWQWTQDCYVPSLAGRPAEGSAVDAPDCRFRVARGGTWGDTPALIRSASRNYAPPPQLHVAEYRSAGFGFRVVTSDVRLKRGAPSAPVR